MSYSLVIATPPVNLSHSAAMSTTTFPRPLAFKGANGLQGIPPTTTAELVIAEVHYITTLKRVGNILSLSLNHSLTTGRKMSNTIRALVERWTNMTHLHSKFHDDIVAIKEDAQGVTKLLNNLLLTLEPLLVDHGRDLSSVIYKLGRNDKRSGHNPSEWDVALRHPFDHLTVYDEWLQRIDPRARFNRECIAHLKTLALNVKASIDANQNPRGMLKRISTLAKGVLRRPPSPSPLLSPQSNRSHGELSSPMTPTTAVSVSTPTTAFTLSSGQKGGYYKYPRPSIDLTLLPDNQIETVADLASTLPLVSDTDNTPEGRVAGTNDAATPLTMAEADTVTTGACDVSSPDRHHRSNRSSDARSNVSSAGSITLASSSESLSTKPSAAALRPVATRTATTTTTASTRTTVTTKTASTTTTTTKPTIVTAVPAPTSAPVSRPVSALAPRRPITTTMQRHRSFDQLQSQKATLRPGTQALIAERAESLQQQQQYSSQSTVFHKDYTQYMAHKEYLNKLQKSPTFVSRPSIDRLRTITKKDSGTRPPVQSLIDFWKQVQEPIEA